MHRAHLVRGHLLDDIHMGAAQALLKKQFPDIDGLQNTLHQYSDSMQPIDNGQSYKCSLSVETQTIIAKYLRPQAK